MGRTEPFQAFKISFQVLVGPYLNSTNAGSIADAEPAASSGNAQDFSGVDQGPVAAADVEYPAAMQKGGRVPSPTLPSYNIMQQPRQSNLSQLSFNFDDAYEKLLKESSAVLTENKQLQTYIRHLEQQMAQLIDHCGALRSSLDLQMRFRQEMEKKYDDHLKINEREAPHGHRARTESGSYQESEATPPQLQDSVGGVKDAIGKEYDDRLKIKEPEAPHEGTESGSYQESEATPPQLQDSVGGVKDAIGKEYDDRLKINEPEAPHEGTESGSLQDSVGGVKDAIGKEYDDRLKIIEPEAPHEGTESGSCQESVGGVKDAIGKKDDDRLKTNEPEAPHGKTESGSYKESEATPPLLQTAVDRVKDAITVCAREFFTTLKKNTSINFDAVLEGVPEHSISNEAMKAGLQGMISRVFFQGFGDPYFSLREKPVPPSQTPSERKSELLQDFKTCRESDPMQLLHDDSDFQQFLYTKVVAMNQEIETRLLRPTEVQFAVESFANGVLIPENENSIYREKFLRVAKLLWVLHKVAMSFEPRAEMFPVSRGSFLDRTYMDDIAAQDGNEEENETAALRKQVMFMCVPGFRVRQTVIKSSVFCIDPTTKPEAADLAGRQTGNGATSENPVRQ